MSVLAQDLVLLLLDNESGRSTVDIGRRHRAVGTAILLDLIRTGKVTVDVPAGDPKAARPVVRDAAATGDTVLDKALSVLADKDRKLGWAAENIGHACWRPQLDALTERGLVRHEEGRFLGVIHTNAWPSGDPSHEEAVVDRIRDAVVGGQEPDEPTLLLVMILNGIGALPALLPDEDRKAVTERAARLVREHTENGPWGEVFKGMDAALFTLLLAG